MNFHLDGEVADCGFTHGDVAGVKLAEVAILIAGVTGPAQGKELPPPHLDATIAGVETAVWPKPDWPATSIHLSSSFALSYL